MYVSRRSIVRGMIGPGSVILGPTTVGGGSFVDANVRLGFPTRSKLRAIKDAEEGFYTSLDRISNGCETGRRCIIRSGTVVYEDVRLGHGVEIGHDALIRAGSSIGNNTRIGTGTQLDGKVIVGRDSNIQSMCYLPHLTAVGKEVFLGPGVVVTNDLYPASRRLVGVEISDRAVVGSGAILLAGTSVGEEAVVGAGAVVTRSVEKNEVVIGSPAKPYITRESYNQKMRRYERQR